MAIRHLGDIPLTGQEPDVDPGVIDLRRPKKKPSPQKKKPKKSKR